MGGSDPPVLQQVAAGQPQGLNKDKKEALEKAVNYVKSTRGPGSNNELLRWKTLKDSDLTNNLYPLFTEIFLDANSVKHHFVVIITIFTMLANGWRLIINML